MNARPVTNNDVYAVAITGSTLLPVLENDVDPDEEELTLVTVSGSYNGEAIIAGEQISYTAPVGFRGNETFQYTVTDPRGGTNTATVTVRVSSPLMRFWIQYLRRKISLSKLTHYSTIAIPRWTYYPSQVCFSLRTVRSSPE